MRHSARRWARSLTNDELADSVPHCRNLRAAFFITRRYDAFYAALIGIYRAELARRGLPHRT